MCDIIKEDLAYCHAETYAQGGWRAKSLGKEKWSDLINAVILEQPDSPLGFHYWKIKESFQKPWAKRVKKRCKEYGFDPLTLFLISIAIRIAIELVIWWLNNRDEPSLSATKKARQMKEYLT